MKAAALTKHAGHGNLDGGDFVIDHAGFRWAGELGSGDYIAEASFTSEAQDSGGSTIAYALKARIPLLLTNLTRMSPPRQPASSRAPILGRSRPPSSKLPPT
ncbi:hypothetical protein M407DRAFT_32745 [Tulasnella calospora MUT 4182]|uniref:Uncharacterized protein n=1 Tax=Tulasnella calospora MUT 4182 TaxID=1051891 RepID=A0A0C3K833_9AGAM|nr:hypothetical protein M407DRAFT_32745 [Tulasnella calospora MUT 4182]